MSSLVLLALYLFGLGTGWLVGAIGVGGVLLVPALVLIGGMGVEAATPVASLSFLFTGIAGTLAYALGGRLSWRVVIWLTVGAAPGAVAGAATNVALSPRLITVSIAVILVAAAVRVLRQGRESKAPRATIPSAAAHAVIGALVGFASALTGTGGPVLLIPVMMLAGGATTAVIAAGQPIQIPIALAATVGFLAFGEIDWPLGIGLGLSQAVGTVAGARFSHQSTAQRLQKLVTVALVVSAAIFVAKAVTA